MMMLPRVILIERLRRDLTQAELASIAGITRETVLFAEKGRSLKLGTLEKIASAFGVVPSYLLSRAEGFERMKAKKGVM